MRKKLNWNPQPGAAPHPLPTLRLSSARFVPHSKNEWPGLQAATGHSCTITLLSTLCVSPRAGRLGVGAPELWARFAAVTGSAGESSRYAAQPGCGMEKKVTNDTRWNDRHSRVSSADCCFPRGCYSTCCSGWTQSTSKPDDWMRNPKPALPWARWRARGKALRQLWRRPHCVR